MDIDSAKKIVLYLKNSQKIKICLSVFLVDLITKLLALNLLPYQKFVNVNSKIYFYLTFNKDASNSALSALGYQNSSVLILINIIGIIYGIIIIITNKYIHKRIFRFLIYFAYLLLYGISSERLMGIFSKISIDAFTLALIKPIFSLFIFTVLLKLCKERVFSVLFSVFVGAGFGNYINLFHPPFGIIDFIGIEYYNSIFNVADVLITFAAILIGIYGMIYIIKSLVKKVNKRKLCMINFRLDKKEM